MAKAKNNRKGSASKTQAPGADAEPFIIKNCALVSISTAKRALTLRELGNRLQTIQSASIYHHFWGSLLAPRFDDPEYKNDFAAWVRHSLHDAVLAERLAVVDPKEFHDIEDLRRELVELIEERLDESELLTWNRAEEPFIFLRSQIVVFDTHRSIKRPERLPVALSKMTLGSVFYHFIDARSRTETRIDDFSAWLGGFGKRYEAVIDRIARVDPFFNTLHELREQLALITKDAFRRFCQ